MVVGRERSRSRLLGVDLPGCRQARLGDAEVVELRPAANRADVVVVLHDDSR